MFDWIGDVVDWIGDGIASIWDNTVGAAVDTVTDAIWNIMFNWLFNLIYGAVADLFEFINATASDIFTLSWVQSFISLFHALAWMLFVCGMIVAVFDAAIAYESGQANIRNTCINVLKGFMAASLVTVVPQRLYSFCVALQGTFTHDLLGGFIADTNAAVADSGLTVITALTYVQHPLLAVGICLSATEVPRIAQMFGLDTSVKVNMMSVSNTVSLGAKALNMIKAKA